MASLLTSFHFLSLKQEINHSFNVDCVKLTSNQKCCNGLYNESKSIFFDSRCDACKKQWGLKKNLKYVEKLFKSCKHVYSCWDFNKPLMLVFNNGVIATIELNGNNNTLQKIEIDDSLNGKLLSSRIVDILFSPKFIFVSYCEPKLSVININPEPPSLRSKILGKKTGKILGNEPKITNIDLIGPASKNIDRKLSINTLFDHLLVWWQFPGEVWPWTPVAYSLDSINMLVYKIDNELQILCTVKINGDLISAHFSKCLHNQILTLEEVKNDQEGCLNVSVYEIIHNQCHHVFLSKLPLQGKLVAFDWNSTDNLIVADSNKMLLLFDVRKRSSLVISLSFIPKMMAWHSQDCVVLVVGLNLELQCFDSGLTCLKFKMFYNSVVNHGVLDLKQHFGHKFVISKLIWQKSSMNNTCLLLLESELLAFILLKISLGCLTGNQLSTTELISQYLKYNSIDEAILLLRSMNWFQADDFNFQCLSNIVNFLLRRPLNMQTQSGIELALGTFYNNIDKLPEGFIKHYKPKVKHIARRFFHHLLRFQQFRKAFLLAVDLEYQDLFLDLSHVAKDKGENILALIALHKANEFKELHCSFSESDTTSCSSTEPSITDEEIGIDFKEDKTIVSSPNTEENPKVEVNYNFPDIKQNEYSEIEAESLIQMKNTPELGNKYSCQAISNSSSTYNWLQQQHLFSNKPQKHSLNNLRSTHVFNYIQNDVCFVQDDVLKDKVSNQSTSNQLPLHSTDSSTFYDPSSNDRLKKLSIELNPIPRKDRAILSDQLKKCLIDASIPTAVQEEDNEDPRIKQVHFGII